MSLMRSQKTYEKILPLKIISKTEFPQSHNESIKNANGFWKYKHNSIISEDAG